jgi:hypothetical protein
VFVISGELHFAEFTQHNFKNARGSPGDLHEVTSSGLTHSVGYKEAVNEFIADTKNVRFELTI